MGWQCISSSCEGHISQSGSWDGVGVAYYSISADIMRLHNAVIDFFFTMTPMMFYILMILFMLVFISALMMAVRNKINQMNKGGQ